MFDTPNLTDLKVKNNTDEINLSEELKLSFNNKKELKNLILKEVNNNYEVIDLIERFFDLSKEGTFVTSTSTAFNIDSLKANGICGIINLKKINDARFINKFFESVNKKLPNSGLSFGCVKTYPNRKKSILEKYPPVINWTIYIFDTLFNRVFPKLKFTKKIYFYLTKGKGRVLSRAETFGRLYSCGYKILDEKNINNIQYFVAKKIDDPFYDSNPSYGPIIRLKRIGKNQKKIFVYKLRTMHPFSEYLQEYTFTKNSLQEGGKIKNDFRITPEGKLFRKFWIDEIPMIYNILKGDMKLVGVRPLSHHFFSLYNKELQDLRTQFKPGFIPPFYVDLPKTLDEIMESESRYLNLCKESEFKTDLKYFFLALKNVLFKGARSS